MNNLEKFLLEIKLSHPIKGNRMQQSFIDSWNTYNPAIFYIRNIIGHYNPSVRVCNLASHTTNFIHELRDLKFLQ